MGAKPTVEVALYIGILIAFVPYLLQRGPIARIAARIISNGRYHIDDQ